MAKQKPRTLSGFMELLPDKQVQFDRMVELLRRSYSLYGFTPLDTPVIEASEVLLAKGGGETEKQMYRFTKGDSDLSLRFDLTVPLPSMWPCTTASSPSPSAGSRSARCTGGNGPSGAGSGSSTRRTST